MNCSLTGTCYKRSSKYQISLLRYTHGTAHGADFEWSRSQPAPCCTTHNGSTVDASWLPSLWLHGQWQIHRTYYSTVRIGRGNHVRSTCDLRIRRKHHLGMAESIGRICSMVCDIGSEIAFRSIFCWFDLLNLKKKHRNYTKHWVCQSSPFELTIFSCGSKPSSHREQNMLSSEPAAIVFLVEEKRKGNRFNWIKIAQIRMRVPSTNHMY